MRGLGTAVLVGAMVLIAAVPLGPPVSAGDVSFGLFHSNLSPHGGWLVSASYGRVWQPRIYRPGWNPYFDGHWAHADVGWTWVSDYSWGAIPYHYGTWVLDPRLGWVWVPGYVWAPSWVVFHNGPGYIGWAPVPVRYSVGFSLRSYDYRPEHFVFVTTDHFLAPRIHHHALPASRNRVIFNRTKIVPAITIENERVVNRGPSVRELEMRTGRKVHTQSVERVLGPGHGRADVRVDRERVGRVVRAAEPHSVSRPLPDRDRVERSASSKGKEAPGKSRGKGKDRRR